MKGGTTPVTDGIGFSKTADWLRRVLEFPDQ